MVYEVGFKPAALRQLRKLDEDVQTAIVIAIESLAENPRPDGCKKLKSKIDFYRIRVANFTKYKINSSWLLLLKLVIGEKSIVKFLASLKIFLIWLSKRV